LGLFYWLNFNHFAYLLIFCIVDYLKVSMFVQRIWAIKQKQMYA